MNKSYSLEVKYEEETDDYYIQFTDEMLEEIGWKIGDTILWKDNKNGTFTLEKKVVDEAGNSETDA
jgi:hypothetical protein